MSSGLGVVPKKNGKLRLIHHLSAPVARSINDGIDKEDYSLHYVTVDNAIEIIMQLGRGCLLAKTDITVSGGSSVAPRRKCVGLLRRAWSRKICTRRSP